MPPPTEPPTPTDDLRANRREGTAPQNGAAPQEGVVLLHGIARRASSLRKMERAFRREGLLTLNLDYPARTAPLETLVEIVAPCITAFSHRVVRLHFATHSMGGLVARGLIMRYRPANLGRVVMLGPPNRGSEVADRLQGVGLYHRVFGPAGAQLGTRPDPARDALLGPVDYPLGIIAGDRTLYPLESWLWLPGPNDGRVTVERTKLPGMRAHRTLHTTHATMMWNRSAIREALHFVREGRFRD